MINMYMHNTANQQTIWYNVAKEEDHIKYCMASNSKVENFVGLQTQAVF